jgi:hypothetical protein
LLDIESGDRVSVDHNDDLLALGGTREDQSRAEQHGRRQMTAVDQNSS